MNFLKKRRCLMNSKTFSQKGCVRVFEFMALLLLIFAFGQNLQAQDTLKAKDVIILKEFEPSIGDAFKIGELPVAKDTVPPLIIEDEMQFFSKKIPVNFEPDPIKAARMKGEPISDIERIYMRVGGGNYGTFMADVYAHNLRSKTANFGLDYHHLSSQGNIPNAENSAFSKNNLAFQGKRIFYNKALSGGARYDRNSFYYYGYNPTGLDSILNTASDAEKATTYRNTQQILETLSADIRFKSYFKDSNLINFDTWAKFKSHNNRNGSIENNIKFNFDVNRYYSSYFAQLKGGVDYNNYSNAVVGEYNNTLLHLNPSVLRNSSKWHVRVGAKVFADIDSATNYSLYPEVFASYNLVNSLIIPYVGIDGGIERNNFHALSSINPFIEFAPTISNQQNRYNAFGGLKGQFSSKASFDIRAQQQRINNYIVFVNDRNLFLANQFNAIRDDVTIQSLKATFTYRHAEKIDFILTGEYFEYNFDNLLEAWHLPTFKSKAFLYYQINHKLLFKFETYYMNRRFAQTFDPNEGESRNFDEFARKLPGFADINLGAEYRYTNRLSFFIDLNNVAAMRYEIWNQYQVQRFAILGGLTYSFWSK